MALTKIDDRGLKTPIDLLDSEKIRLGTGNDLELYHDGSNGWLKNGTNTLILGSDLLELKNGAGTEAYLKGTANGAVELFYDNSRRLDTAATGIRVLGPVDSNCDVILWADNGTDWTDGVRLRVADAGPFTISGYNNSGTAETFIEANINGAVELFNDGSKKLETTSTGLRITPGGDTTTVNASTSTSSDAFILGVNKDGTDPTEFAIKTQASGGSSVERIRIASDGNITIGQDGDSGGAPSAGYDELVIEGGNENIGMCFLSPAANNVTQQISFGDSNNNQSGRIIYNHASDYMSLGVGSGADNERLRILSSGGITFNGDTAAANALDDYEEGTWTPVVNQGIDGGASYQTQAGYYVKVGQLVHASFHLRFVASSTGSTGNGNNFRLGGLPFNSLNSSNYSSGGLITYTNVTFNSSDQKRLWIGTNSSIMEMYHHNNTASAVPNNSNSGADIYGYVTYRSN